MQDIEDIAEKFCIEIVEVPGCGEGRWSKQGN